MHDTLNWLAFFLIVDEDLLKTFKVHDVMLVEFYSSLELFGGDFVGYNLFNSGKNIGEAVGQIVDDNTL